MTLRARLISHLIAAVTVFASLAIGSQLFIEYLEDAPGNGSTPNTFVVSVAYATFGTLTTAIPLVLVDFMARPVPPRLQILALTPVVLLTLTIWSLLTGQPPSLLIFCQFVYWAALWAVRLFPASRRAAFWGHSAIEPEVQP